MGEQRAGNLTLIHAPGTASGTAADAAQEEDSAAHPWLIRAKLEAPLQQVALVDRPRLLATLDRMLEHRLGLIVAPAGFGKTTLLNQWRGKLAERGAKVAWLTLDEDDSDARQLLAYIVFALTSSGVNLGRLEMLVHQGLLDLTVRAAVNALLESISAARTRVVLILDDYHRLQSAEADDLVRDLISAAPRNFTIVVNSRMLPGLDASRMLAAGQALEIGPEALRFSREETRAAVDAAMPDDALEVLFERTEGWAVALQLARLLLQGQSMDRETMALLSGDRGHVASYLADQVLSQLHEGAQQFLMCTSILERFNAQLANAVCERGDAWAMLQTLAPLRALMVPLQGEGGWLRYHHLFAEFLQELLQRRRPQSIGRLHLLAAGWFEKEGHVSEAVRHARLANDFDRCARLIEQAGGWELILFGGIGALRSLLRNVPDRELQRFPRLQLAAAYLKLKEGDVHSARALFDAASQSRADTSSALRRDLLNVSALLDAYEDRWEDSLEHREPIPLDDAVTRGVMACHDALTALARGRFADADECVRGAMRAMRQGNTILGLNYCYLHAGLSSFYQARCQAAEADYSEARRLAEDNFGADSGLRYISDILLGGLHYWRGDFDEQQAAQFLDALDQVEHSDGWFEIYAIGLSVDVAASLDRGDLFGARAAAERAQRTASKRGIERLADIAQAQRMRILMREGQRDEALRCIERLTRSHPPGCWRTQPVRWRPFVEIALALAECGAAKDITASLEVLDDAVSCTRTTGAKLLLISCLVARAQLRDQNGDRAAALSDALEALDLAAPEQIRRPFLGSARLSSLLRAAHRRGREEAVSTLTLRFASDVIGRGSDNRASNNNSGQGVLSGREYEVLRELSAGLSNKRIARALDMTEHTVKFHLKNIFIKLKVDRRTRAIAEARRMDLLP